MELIESIADERAEAMDPEIRRSIEERAYALWDAEGRPEGKAIDYWLRAEQELVYQSTAGEEDPLAGADGEDALEEVQPLRRRSAG